MVSQVNNLRRLKLIQEPTLGSIRNRAAQIRDHWTADEKIDRQHQAWVSQQRLLRACGLIPGELEDVITVPR
jgi:hypothetical protein